MTYMEGGVFTERVVVYMTKEQVEALQRVKAERSFDSDAQTARYLVVLAIKALKEKGEA